MFIWYDFEFLERGPAHPIIPISVGMVREDNATLYLINGDFPIDEFVEHDWLRENVAPHLPVVRASGARLDRKTGDLTDGYLWDEDHPDYDYVWGVRSITQKVEEFILGGDGSPAELWGYYPAYDHVCLAQLWGRMVDLPDGIPMHTNCVKQTADMMGATIDTTRDGDAHHALADALWTRDVFVELMDAAMRLTVQAYTAMPQPG